MESYGRQPSSVEVGTLNEMNVLHTQNLFFSLQIVLLYIKLRWHYTRHITECDVCDQFTLLFLFQI